MYRCGICQAVSRPGETARKHVIYRDKVQGVGKMATVRKEIDREIPICSACATVLDKGESYSSLVRRMRRVALKKQQEERQQKQEKKEQREKVRMELAKKAGRKDIVPPVRVGKLNSVETLTEDGKAEKEKQANQPVIVPPLEILKEAVALPGRKVVGKPRKESSEVGKKRPRNLSIDDD